MDLSNFWSWFAENAERLWEDYDFPENLEEIHQRLRKEDPRLQVRVQGVTERVLEFTARHVEDFERVRRFVEAAPSVPRWTFRAFRPPIELVGWISYVPDSGEPDDVLSCKTPTAYLSTDDDVRFRMERSGNRVDLRLFVRGLQGPRSEQLTGLACVMVSTALGEYDYRTKIRELSVHDLEPWLYDTRPIKELKSAFDSVDWSSGAS